MKTIGNFLFCYLLITTQLLVSCDLVIKLFSYTGEPITKVIVGVPFQMHVVSNGDCDIEQIKFGPSFDLCHLNAAGVIKSLSSINGVSKRAITHKYLARIDQPGQYRLAPVQAWHDQKMISESQIVIDAYEQAFDLNKRPALELQAHKSQFYLGEQINLVVRLYLDSMQLTAPELNLPQDWHDQLQVVAISKFTQGASGSRQYLEWHISVIAKQLGKVMLPAVSTTFEKVSQKNSFFMFNNKEKIVLFSNIIKLDIIDLPPTDRVVQGIGEFYALNAKVDHGQITASRAAQLQLELTGDVGCNWSKIALPELANLPANLQAYQGPISQADQSKTFQFILQGIALGKCVLPAQSFYYFNTKTKQYQTLHSEPLALEVMSIYDLPANNLTTAAESVPAVKIDLSIRPILTDLNFDAYKRYSMPIWLFVFGLLIPIWALILGWLINFYTSNSKKNRLVDFERQLLKIIKNDQPELLYDFFRQVFVDLFGLSKEQVDLHQISELFKQKAVSTKQINEFSLFYAQLISFKFGNRTRVQTDYAQLFVQAQHWLLFLGELKRSIC